MVVVVQSAVHASYDQPSRNAPKANSIVGVLGRCNTKFTQRILTEWYTIQDESEDEVYQLILPYPPRWRTPRHLKIYGVPNGLFLLHQAQPCRYTSTIVDIYDQGRS
jgi:hypothetical protein